MNWNEIIIWIVIIIIHEHGHYIAYRYHGIKPNVILRWWGIQIGEEKDMAKLTSHQMAKIAMAGIIYPMPLLFFTEFYWIYIFMCSFDALIIFTYSKVKHLKAKNHLMSIIKWNIQENKILREKIKRYKEDDNR